jgi:hypothetical protein
MPHPFTLTQELPLVGVLDPAADAAGRNGRAVTLKNALKAFVVFFINQGNAATVACSVEQCTAVAGTGNKAIAATRIWTKLDTSIEGDFVRQTDATSFTTDAALKPKLVVFEIDPAKLDKANSYDCIRPVTGASNAANITAAQVFIVPSYAGDKVGDLYTD